MPKTSRSQLRVDFKRLNHFSDFLSNWLRATPLSPRSFEKIKKILCSWKPFIACQKQRHYPDFHRIAAQNGSRSFPQLLSHSVLTKLVAAIGMKSHVLRKTHKNGGKWNNWLYKLTERIIFINLESSHEGDSVAQAVIVLKQVRFSYCFLICLLERNLCVLSSKLELREEACPAGAELRQAKSIHSYVNCTLTNLPSELPRRHFPQRPCVRHSSQMIRIALRKYSFFDRLIQGFLFFLWEIIPLSPFVKIGQ